MTTLNSNFFQKMEAYGEKTICYLLNAKGSNKNTSLAIVKANELVELDGGRELLRTESKELPSSFELNGNKLDFNIIYATPDTKGIAQVAAKKYDADIVMIYE